MSFMFQGATPFNKNIYGWNVDNVAYYDDFYTSSGLDDNSDLLYVPEKFRPVPPSINQILDIKRNGSNYRLYYTLTSDLEASDVSTIYLESNSGGSFPNPDSFQYVTIRQILII
jgi:hypothetical protein